MRCFQENRVIYTLYNIDFNTFEKIFLRYESVMTFIVLFPGGVIKLKWFGGILECMYATQRHIYFGKIFRH